MDRQECDLVQLEVKWHHCYVKVTASCYVALQHIQDI